MTRCLPQADQVKAQCPAFHAKVLVPGVSLPSGCVDSVAEAFRFLGGAMAGLDPMAVWREHLHTLVPNPGGLSGSYRGPAEWMNALAEVNRARYDTLLAQWRTEFKLRRNLWADMASAGCPMNPTSQAT